MASPCKRSSDGGCWQSASVYIKGYCKGGGNNPFSMANMDRIRSHRLRLLQADSGKALEKLSNGKASETLK